jgi:hypothetical protein
MKFSFIDFFLNRMQTRKKFKQCVEGGFDVSNELASSIMMEDVALAKIKAFC